MAIAKYNILIAHSDKLIIERLEEEIHKIVDNCTIIKVQDGNQAIRTIEQMRMNFAFLDMELPRRSGDAILEDIRSLKLDLWPSLVYIMSDFEDENLVSRSQRMKVSFLSDIEDLSLFQKQLDDFKNPKRKKVQAAAKPSTQNMDAELMNPIINATLKVLEVMVPLEAKKNSVVMEKASKFCGDISAYYPIVSEKFSGFFCVSFPKDVYLKVMSDMLFDEFTEINEENLDGIGELCNQIFGNAKAHYNENMQSEIKMATPVIEVKQLSKVISALPGNKVVVTFDSEHGQFFIELNMSYIK